MNKIRNKFLFEDIHFDYLRKEKLGERWINSKGESCELLNKQ